jgi:hypothetical protein
MNYVFHVREWNIDFFNYLENSIISKEIESNIIWLTMTKVAYNILIFKKKNVYYLPELFERNTEVDNRQYIKQLDNFMFEKFHYGIQYIYELERFKPYSSKEAEKFISAHISTLIDIFPESSKMISLTCDHFVYIISAYINEYKGGQNYFIQPIGFPQNAQVIMQNPWDLNYFRNSPLEKNILQQYIESLDLDPKESIHYMKPQKLPSLGYSFIKRIRDLTTYKPTRSIFSYLEPSNTNIIPGRYTKKNKIDYNFDYLLETDIKIIASANKIFYYPLQFEPEMSILAYSPWIKSQREVIRLISQSLKKDDILLLKENPKMIGQRELSFYEEIDKNSNVKWAHPVTNSRVIIRSSFKVISITGTATIEAACLGINSMIFGYPPFRKLLIAEPVSDQPLNNFIDELYKIYSSEEILNYLNKNWGEFSESLFLGNFIPTYVNNHFTINESSILAKQFVNEVL